MRLTGKSALVTGAGSGLGRATALTFSGEGAAVVCVDLDEAEAEATAAQIRSAGGEAETIGADLSDPAQAERMAAAALDSYAAIDVIFAGAGIVGSGDAVGTEQATWDRVIAVNLTSKWLSFKFLLPSMVERGSGSIIVMASIAGVIGIPGIFPYAAAKGGCIAMARQAAIEFAGRGVRVNSISPGTIPTPLVRSSYTQRAGATAGDRDVEDALARAGERYPLQRLGEPDHVAQLAVHLAGDESSWTTGQNFVVDGGFTAA